MNSQDNGPCDTASIYIMFFIHVLWTIRQFLQKVKNILEPVLQITVNIDVKQDEKS